MWLLKIHFVTLIGLFLFALVFWVHFVKNTLSQNFASKKNRDILFLRNLDRALNHDT